MCRISVAIDQSIHSAAPVLATVEASSFFMRSIRLLPVAWSSKADIHLSLGGGSKDELDELLGSIEKLPAVLSTNRVLPAIWVQPE